MRTWEDYKKTMIAPVSLTRAAKENDLPTLNALLDAGNDINTRDYRGYTPLMLAAYSCNREALQLLIKRGADLDRTDHAGNTPLMGVAFKGNKEIAEILIAAGANVLAKNHSGMDAYDVAATFGRSHLVQLFSKHGIQKNKVKKIKVLWNLCIEQIRNKILQKKLQSQ